MPFHVQIRRGFRRAAEFNLGAADVRSRIVEPWRRGKPVMLGDREWDPRESSLCILEGPVLPSSDLGLGQGWNNAERSAEDATRRILAEVGPSEPTALVALADSDAAALAAAEVLEGLGLRSVDRAALNDSAAIDALAARLRRLGENQIDPE